MSLGKQDFFNLKRFAVIMDFHPDRVRVFADAHGCFRGTSMFVDIGKRGLGDAIERRSLVIV